MPLGLIPSFKSEREAIGGIMRNINSIWDHLNVEIKHHDTTRSGTISSTPTFYGLTDIASGITGSSQNSIDVGYRDGDKIRVKTVNAKVVLRNTVATTEVCWAYIIKHYDNFSGVGPIWDDIYDPTSADNNAVRLRSNEQLKQYKILARRRVVLSGIEDGDNDKLLNLYVKNKKRVGSFVEYEGTGAVDPSSGKYYLVLFNDNNYTVGFETSARVTYVDN